MIHRTEINCEHTIKKVREIAITTCGCEFIVIYGVERGRGFCYLPYQEEGCSLNAKDKFANVEYNTERLCKILETREEAEGIAKLIREYELSLKQ